MEKKERISELLSNEGFQNDIKYFGTSLLSEEAIVEKYSISKDELIYVKRLILGLTFKNEQLSQDEIGYAVNKLEANITTKASHSILKQGQFIRVLSRVAAILTIPLLFSTLYLYDRLKDTDSLYISQLDKTDLKNIVESPLGAKTQVVLPDGSLVWLNSGSRLTYPIVFSGSSRNVELQGEAFFDVVKNEKIPMVLSTGNVKVKVYGTQFNVNAYADDRIVETTLVEGVVTLMDSDNDEVPLKPGYTAIYSETDSEIHIVKVKDMDVYVGWKEGKLVFRDHTFQDIISDLERWYNVDIQLKDQSLGNYKLHATFYDESVEQVLDMFSSSIPIEIDYPKRERQADGTFLKRRIIINRNTRN